jgi:hypothetical protein
MNYRLASGSLGALALLCGACSSAGPVGKWTPGPSLTIGRWGNNAVNLDDGSLLIVGPDATNVTTAETLDPAGTAFRTAGKLGAQHGGPVVARTSNGRVLVAGGNPGVLFHPTNAVEVFDPTSRSWSATGSLNVAREEAAGAALPDGTVLVCGGIRDGTAAEASCELYDPKSGRWSLTTVMSGPRHFHAMVALSDGRFLVIGGNDYMGHDLASAELYDRATDRWTPTGSLSTPHPKPYAIVLGDGTVLAMGDVNPPEVYDPKSGAWSQWNVTNAGNAFDAAVGTADGGALLCCGVVTTTVLCSPSMRGCQQAASGAVLRSVPMLGLLRDGRVLVAGGTDAASQALTSTEVFTR